MWSSHWTHSSWHGLAIEPKEAARRGLATKLIPAGRGLAIEPKEAGRGLAIEATEAGCGLATELTAAVDTWVRSNKISQHSSRKH